MYVRSLELIPQVYISQLPLAAGTANNGSITVFGGRVALVWMSCAAQFAPSLVGMIAVTVVYRSKVKNISLLCQALKNSKSDSCSPGKSESDGTINECQTIVLIVSRPPPDEIHNLSVLNTRRLLLLQLSVAVSATLNSILFQLDVRVSSQTSYWDALGSVLAFFVALFYSAPLAFAATFLVTTQIFGTANVGLIDSATTKFLDFLIFRFCSTNTKVKFCCSFIIRDEVRWWRRKRSRRRRLP